MDSVICIYTLYKCEHFLFNVQNNLFLYQICLNYFQYCKYRCYYISSHKAKSSVTLLLKERFAKGGWDNLNLEGDNLIFTSRLPYGQPDLFSCLCCLVPHPLLKSHEIKVCTWTGQHFLLNLVICFFIVIFLWATECLMILTKMAIKTQLCWHSASYDLIWFRCP